MNFDTEYCCKDALSNHGQTYLFRKLTDALHASIPGSKVRATSSFGRTTIEQPFLEIIVPGIEPFALRLAS